MLVIFIIISINVFATPDFSEVNDSLNGVVNESPEEIIEAILENKMNFDGKNIIEKIFSLFIASVKNVLPHILSLFTVSVIISVVEKLKLINNRCENAVMIGGKIIFTVILISSSSVFISNSKECLEKISGFTDALMPIIITLLASIGAKGTVTILGPSQVLLSSVLINICVNVIFPLIIIGFVTVTINGILPDNKLKGIADLMKNFSTWCMGGVFMIYSAIIAIQGAVSGVTDGISVKSIKYALSSSVPIIGSSISDSFSSVLLSALSIKSAAGIMGIIIILTITIAPIINIWAYISILNVFSACVHPFAGDFVCSQIKNMTQFLKLSATVLLGVSVLWFIYLGVIILAGGNLI